MLKKWLLAGAVMFSGSAFVAHEADAFGHHRRGQRSSCCNPCGGGYTQPTMVQQPVSGGCCGATYSPGHGSQGGHGAQGGHAAQGGYGQTYSSGYGGYNSGYGYGNRGGAGLNTGMRGVGAGMRGVGAGMRGVTSGVRGALGGVTGR
jgi:hypothetical protein